MRGPLRRVMGAGTHDSGIISAYFSPCQMKKAPGLRRGLLFMQQAELTG